MVVDHWRYHLVPIALFALAHYAAIIGLAALTYTVGRRLTRKCEYHSAAERAAVCTSLGLGALSYLVFCLCLVHWLYPTTVLVTLGLVAILCFPELRSLTQELTGFLRAAWKSRQLPGISMGGLIIFLPFTLLPLYPPTNPVDAMWYHLPEAKLYLQHHGFVFAPHIHFSLFPQLNEMLFTLMLALFDVIAAQLVSFLMMVVLTIAVLAWGERLFSRTVACWAAAILLGIPAVIRMGSVAYIDIGLTLFFTMALYAVWNWLRGRDAHWLILSAVFAGFAAGTKYSGLFVVALSGLIILSYGIRERQHTPSLVFSAMTVAIAAPWYARSLYYTGNPVFPFLPGIFGYGFWSLEDVSYTLYDIHHFAVPISIAGFVSLPWQLAFNPQIFIAEAPANPGFFLAVPALVAFVWKDVRIRALCAVAFMYVLFWFFDSQQTRFLLPVLPLICLSMAAALNSILQWRPFVRRWAGHRLVIGVIFAVLIFPGWIFAADVRVDGPVPTTQEARDRYLADKLPLYPAYKLLNTLHGHNYTLYALEYPFMVYYADGTQIGDAVGPARYSRIFSRLADSRALYSELRSLGATYLLLSRDPSRLHVDGFFQGHFKLVWARPPAMMFEIVERIEAPKAP